MIKQRNTIDLIMCDINLLMTLTNQPVRGQLMLSMNRYRRGRIAECRLYIVVHALFSKIVDQVMRTHRYTELVEQACKMVLI